MCCLWTSSLLGNHIILPCGKQLGMGGEEEKGLGWLYCCLKLL